MPAFFFSILSLMQKKPLFKIYKGIVCLEDYAPDGGKWWDVGYGLAFRPYKITDIRQVRYGRLQGSGSTAGRQVLAAMVDGGWVAINLPRSDVPSLKAAKLWPPELVAPYERVERYSEWPV